MNGALLCLLTFRCLHSMARKYLSSYIKHVSVGLLPSRASLRSSTSGQLLIPRARTKIFGNRSFSFSAQTALNSLTKDLHDISIPLLTFKSMSKRHLFRPYSFTVAERRALLSLHLRFAALYKFSLLLLLPVEANTRRHHSSTTARVT